MRFFFLAIAAALSVACTDSNIRPISNSEANTNSQPQSVIAHTTENQTPKPANTAKWTPGGEAIDTKELDAAIMKAEKEAAGRSNDPTAKKALGEAFFRRAVALTEARQYASAIGDYRRALKNDPANSDAKVWIDKITTIYASLGKQPPKEGEEPPALPFTVDQQ
jgi:tetratricopeptide (TPR) repeat protein